MTHDITVREAVAWLGLTWEQYEAMHRITAGHHGSPQLDAVMAVATAEKRAATNPAAVLSQFGIDPTDPCAAAHAYVRMRAQFADTPKDFE